MPRAIKHRGGASPSSRMSDVVSITKTGRAYLDGMRAERRAQGKLALLSVALVVLAIGTALVDVACRVLR